MGLNYYAEMKYAPLSDLLRQAIINTENQLMDISDYIWKYCPDSGRSTVAYTIFYQGAPIDHSIHAPGLVSQSGANCEYNAACTAWIALAHFIMLMN